MEKTSFFKYNVNIIKYILTQQNLNADDVKARYESKNIVNLFETQEDLQKPEQAILTGLMGKLAGMRMLDIGVGTGRTSRHFAPLVKEYVGIDYSAPMIEVCRRKNPKLKFEVADARNLKAVDDAYFDFVLFSYNGLDSVEHNDRLKILYEIRRITKHKGIFCFSTHNLNSFLSPPTETSKNPLVSARRIHAVITFRLLNQKAWKNIRNPCFGNRHTMVCSEHNNMLFKTYYISPTQQCNQLRDAGFAVPKIYGLDGKEIKKPDAGTDNWLYFLCEAA